MIFKPVILSAYIAYLSSISHFTDGNLLSLNHLSLRGSSTCIHEKAYPNPLFWELVTPNVGIFFSELGSTLKQSVKPHTKFTL